MINPTKVIKTFLTAVSAIVLLQCADEEQLLPNESMEEDITISAASITSPALCSSCTYVVPSNAKTQVVDGKLLGLKPGAVICLNALNTYANITFRNIVGTADNPIIITNCGGTATMTATGLPYNLKTEYSKYFKITGGSGTTRGIKIIGGHMGMTLEKLSTNFVVNNVEVYNTSFAGIMAKTDPTCDDATIRGNFTMRNVYLHDNYVHDTKGEAFYVGHSFYSGVTLDCGLRLPHLVEGVKIYNNKIINSGWESIQVGCALKGAYVYNNTITNYGAMNEPNQNSGIQFSSGTKGICYNNFINGGAGTAINVIGHGDSFLHDNIILNAGAFGIFADERTSPGAGFRFINNTIINPQRDGIRTYGDLVPNIILNNIIVNPGSYVTYTYPRTGNDAYVYLLNKYMNVQIENNIFTRDINFVKFSNPAANNYRISSISPALDKGKDITTYSIPIDYYRQTRLKGTNYDIGASEY
jgi:hypothetical protein